MAGLPDPAAHRITVRRDSLLEDSFDALRHSGPALKQRLQVNFISSTGAPEAGVDAGGLVKEFLEEASDRCPPWQGCKVALLAVHANSSCFEQSCVSITSWNGILSWNQQIQNNAVHIQPSSADDSLPNTMTPGAVNLGCTVE